MEQTVETVSWGLFWRFIEIMHKRAHSYANNIKAQQKVVIFTTSLSLIQETGLITAVSTIASSP